MYHASKIPLSLQCLKINIAASSAGRRWTLRTEDTAEKMRNGKAMRKAYLSNGRQWRSHNGANVGRHRVDVDAFKSQTYKHIKHIQFVARQQKFLKYFCLKHTSNMSNTCFRAPDDSKHEVLLIEIRQHTTELQRGSQDIQHGNEWKEVHRNGVPSRTNAHFLFEIFQ